MFGKKNLPTGPSGKSEFGASTQATIENEKKYKEEVRKDIILRRQIDQNRERIDTDYDRIDQSYIIFEEAWKAQ